MRIRAHLRARLHIEIWLLLKDAVAALTAGLEALQLAAHLRTRLQIETWLLLQDAVAALTAGAWSFAAAAVCA